MSAWQLPKNLAQRRAKRAHKRSRCALKRLHGNDQASGTRIRLTVFSPRDIGADYPSAATLCYADNSKNNNDCYDRAYL